MLAEYFFKSLDIKYREVVFYLLLVKLSSFWEDFLLDVLNMATGIYFNSVRIVKSTAVTITTQGSNII